MAKAQAVAQTTQKKETSHWLILIFLALAQFMVVLDASIVNVALKSIQASFHMSTSNLQWIVTAYALTFGGFLLLGGRAADLFGRRKVFLIGVTAFIIASLADGLAPSGGFLIVFRAIQGLAGAFMSPAALSIVLVTYNEGHERNVALSVWGAVASGGAAAGVLFGGIFTQFLGWRFNFFINVPVGILVLIVARRIVPRHESTAEHRHLDAAGAVLITGSLMLLVYGLTEAPAHGWTSVSSLIYFGLFILGIIGFIFNEQRSAHPLIPLKIFKIRNLSGGDSLMMLMAASLFAAFFFVSLFIQDVMGFSPSRTGVSFLVIPFAIAAVATNVPKVIQKIGFRPILIVAPLFVSAAFLLLSRIHVGAHYWTTLAPGLILLGLGAGGTFVATSIAATSGVAKHESGLASGLLNTSQQLGGALGLAILAGIAASSTSRFVGKLHGAPSKLQVATATVHGFHDALLTAAGFALMASLLGVFVIRQPKGVISAAGAEPVAAMH
jgi:EmrB/QacA subfamily drug resistance transporter